MNTEMKSRNMDQMLKSSSSSFHEVNVRSGDTTGQWSGDCIITIEQDDDQGLCLSEKEDFIDQSKPPVSLMFNPNVPEFIPHSRNLSTNYFLIPDNNLLPLELTGSSNPRLQEVSARSEDTTRQWSGDCIITIEQDDDQELWLSEQEPNIYQSKSTLSLVLNPYAREFVSQSRNLSANVSSDPNNIQCLHEVKTRSGDTTGQWSGDCIITIEQDDDQEHCLSEPEPFIGLSKPTQSPIFNPNAPEFIPESRKVSSHLLDNKNDNQEQASAILKSDNSSFTLELMESSSGVSLHEAKICSEKAIQMWLDESLLHVVENDTQTSFHSQSEYLTLQSQSTDNILTACLSQLVHLTHQSRPTLSGSLNPNAAEFIPQSRSLSLCSLEIDDTTNHNLEETSGQAYPDDTPLTWKVAESLSTCVNGVTSVSEDFQGKLLNECTSAVEEEAAETACLSQKEHIICLSQLTESCKLNSCAEAFIPQSRNLSSVSPKPDDKNHNVGEDTRTASNPENMPITSELLSQLSIFLNGVTQKSEDTVEKWLAECISSVDENNADTHFMSEAKHLICQSQLTESLKLNPCAKTFVPQPKCLSTSSSLKTDSSSLKKSDTSSVIAWDDSEAETEHIVPLNELNKNQDAATSTSAPMRPVVHQTITTTLTTIDGFSNQQSVNLDVPSNNFCRTPGHKYQGCLRFNVAADHPEINGADPEQQHQSLQKFSQGQCLQNDGLLDIPHQMFNPLLDHDMPVSDEPECDVTNLTARAERAEMEAERCKLRVSSLKMSHVVLKTQYQCNIRNLNKRMEAEKKASANTQMQILDLTKQVTISRIDKKLIQTGHHVRMLHEAMLDKTSTMAESELQDTYRVLCSYTTACNVLKLQVEVLAQNLLEKLQCGLVVDMSVIDKHPPNCPEFHV